MDKLKLEYERKRAGISTVDFCRLIGISRSAYSRKCKGDTEFTRAEIQKIIDILNLDDPMAVFFVDEVS